jgi:leucyl/phenylalanyl-tRNA--protein transferase
LEKFVYKYYDLLWKEVLSGYSVGIFPMGDDDGTIGWYETNPRAILPIELPTSKIHITRSLSQVLKKNTFQTKIDTRFDTVIRLCSSRESTWINHLIKKAYCELFELGYAHCVETWYKNELVGGLYGVAYKGAFFGESMFYTKSNASKVAVVRLYEILKKNKFILLDIQMMTSHFKTFGAVDISKKGYLEILERAMEINREFKW